MAPQPNRPQAASILIVDDDRDMALLLKKFLDRAAYRVRTAPNVSEALELLRIEGADLILTDQKMPGLSGLDLLRRVRERAPQTPVVLMTAFGDVQTYLEAMNLGAFEYLNKPVRLHDLYAVVRKALGETAELPLRDLASASGGRK